MEKYIFVLGRDNELSILELTSFLEARNINFDVEYRDDQHVVVSLERFDFSIREFGGITKIAKVILENINNEEIEYELNRITFDYGNKIRYSINGDNFLRDYFKERFKHEGVKAYLKSDVSRPSDSLRLDFEILRVKNFIGRIIQVSNPEEYKKRDEKRPRFDEKRVISIRLAKILINISKAKTEILDPFCGTGTILQEALLKHMDAIGVDKDAKDAEMNLKWLAVNFDIKNKYKLVNGDARELSKYIDKTECVVTEPYLGPFMKEGYNKELVLRLKEELTRLYRDFLCEADKIVRGRIVLIAPVFKIKRDFVKLDMNDILRNTKFSAYKSEYGKIPVIYSPHRTRLIREIWILERFK